MESIKLQSSDGEIFEVVFVVIKCSGYIDGMLKTLGFDETNLPGDVFPLLTVNSATLRKVIEFCEYHKDDHKDEPIPSSKVVDDETEEKRTDDMISWDIAFMKVDQGTLFELMIAANFLDIRSLMDVTTKTMANMIRGKEPDDIRNTFNIKNNFSAAEEEQIRKENTWCEEK